MGVMVLSDDIVGCFNIGYEDVSVFDLHFEFALESIVDVDRGSDIGKALGSTEIGFEGNRDR